MRPPDAPVPLSRQVFRWGAALGAAVLLANAFFGERGWLETVKVRDAHRSLAADIVQLRQDNRALADEARRLRHDPAAVEELARGELGLIRPGERLFIITDRSGTR